MKSTRTCPWWLAATFDNPFRRFFHNPAVILGDLVTPGQTVIDLGCGMGYFSLAMAKMVAPDGQVIAVDLQSQMLAGARRSSVTDYATSIHPRSDRHNCPSGLYPGFLDGS
jgi:2-polyprenyl-3-methyl-5-hydroxy-6-metoxy-1,4-benzoquinol methylase